MNIKSIPISEIHRAAYNPRKALKPGDPAYDKLKKAVTAFGLVEPLVWNSRTKNLVGGHQRLSVIEERGDREVEVSVVDLDEREEKMLNLALNKHAGEWDFASLADMLQELDAGDVDMEITGFDQAELEKMMTWTAPNAGLTDGDAVPEPPKVAKSRPGDLWLLGKHRLLCGDATIRENVERLIGKKAIDACITDPPYGVGVDYRIFEDTEENVAILIRKIMPLLLSVSCAALTPGVPAMWSYPKPAWVGAWVHPAPSGGCPWGFVGNNPILFYGADPYLKNGLGRRPDSLVLASDRQGVDGHPTPKPFKVWSWLLERVTTASGQIALDPFVGSGTTIIAAESTGRVCYALEIDPVYVDVAVQRWEQFTGKTAELLR